MLVFNLEILAALSIQLKPLEDKLEKKYEENIQWNMKKIFHEIGKKILNEIWKKMFNDIWKETSNEIWKDILKKLSNEMWKEINEKNVN